MSALDTAKEIIRIGSTAGISKDVIDLLEKKSALLEEQIAALERENSQLKTENAKFRAQHEDSTSGFFKNDGLLWKRSPSGFERRPYCPRCADHPVMMEFPPGSDEMWVCPSNHTFAYDSKPPMTLC